MKKTPQWIALRRITSILAIPVLVNAPLGMSQSGNGTPAIVVSAQNKTPPSELNPPFTSDKFGGAPNATPAQAAAFAWQEFIALNWPAGPQSGKLGQRDTPDSTCLFSDPKCTGPTVWQTYRGKVEIFPGVGSPPGYSLSDKKNDTSFGYDALPRYKYAQAVDACDSAQENDPVPWVNLDETDEINLANMYAGNAPYDNSGTNSSPHLIRFLAKANRAEYAYVAGNSSPADPKNQWWSQVPANVVAETKNYLAANMASPPAGSATMVSLPNGTIEVKAGWRPLSTLEMQSGRFHMQTVRYYETTVPNGTETCYRDKQWGLVALHIIQKTPSAPYFIYATFEQADNILDANGSTTEDEDGNLKTSLTAPTSPQECLVDPRPPLAPTKNPPSPASAKGSVILTSDTETCKPLPVESYCTSSLDELPRFQLAYINERGAQPLPNKGYICVNQRANLIPDYAIAANQQAHQAIRAYLGRHNLKQSPWLSYKLINVQYVPYDKVITTVTPNGSLYESEPPFTAQNPAPSSYYMANIVVETNRSLQLFSGGLSPQPEAAIVTSWNVDGTPHKNVYHGGNFHAMGGCMGCHGAAGQNRPGSAGDFSVILAVGRVKIPEIPSIVENDALTKVPRNRKLE
jgi:hypothetical protein